MPGGFRVRDGRGEIIDAYGIDLRPLFLRVPELETLRDRLNQEAAERRAIRSRISATISALKRLAMDRGQPLSEDVESRLQGLQKLCRRSRVAIVELLAAEKSLTQLCDTVHPTPDHDVLPDNTPADAGQSVRPIESQKKENTTPHGTSPVETLWDQCPRLAVYFPDRPRDARQLAKCLQETLTYLGFSERSSIQMLRDSSMPRLLRAVEDLLSRLKSVENPRAYLLTMLRNPERLAGKRWPSSTMA